MVIQVRSKMSEIRCQKSDADTHASNRRVRSQFCLLCYGLCAMASVLLSSCAGPLAIDPVLEATKAIENADTAMGDWEGNWKLNDESDSGRVVTQVIALGKGNYRAKVLEEFDTREEPIAVLDGRRDGAVVRFAGPGRYEYTEFKIEAAIKDGKFSGSFTGDEVGSFAMDKAIRVSPTLGDKPPAGAIVLFNGKNFKQWKHTKKKPGAD